MENLHHDTGDVTATMQGIDPAPDLPEITLTKNESLVFGVLQEEAAALGAYDILDKLRDHGVTAPPTVYRALTQLIEKQLVKRIESTRKFVIAEQSISEEAVAVCHECGSVAPLSIPEFFKELKSMAAHSGFDVDCYTIEAVGKCSDCTTTKD